MDWEQAHVLLTKKDRRIPSNAASWSSAGSTPCCKQGWLSSEQAPEPGHLHACRTAARRPLTVARLTLLLRVARRRRSARGSLQTAHCPGTGSGTRCPGSWAFLRQWLSHPSILAKQLGWRLGNEPGGCTKSCSQLKGEISNTPRMQAEITLYHALTADWGQLDAAASPSATDTQC